MDKLEDIGFYTLSDKRCATASEFTSLERCEVVLSARCNFRCPYCRSIGGKDMPLAQALDLVRLWALEGLKNIRFSGGEPTLYPGILGLVRTAKAYGAERIAVSTNGSASRDMYDYLLEAGVNDFSVSLDACCAEDGDLMAGGIKGAWNTVTENIKYLAAKTYVTVGVVLTEQNVGTIEGIIRFADSLGVQDIRIIPAAQDGDRLRAVQVAPELLAKYPILAYRIRNIQAGKPVRGLNEGDSKRCGLAVDDMAVCGDQHYPCIIYMRESGPAIGKVGPNMRAERAAWSKTHDTHADPICASQCLDVCVDYNNRFARFREGKNV